MSSVSQYSRATAERPTARATSSPPKPPPRINKRLPAIASAGIASSASLEDMPAVSVLLPVRDAGAYLAPSLASLWRQTLRDFEVVAVNDGSADGSGEMLERFARRERRLRVIHLPASGLPTALNAGLAAARGRWIARHDADDLSRRRRLELQREFLAAHPHFGVVGSRVRIIPASPSWLGMRRWAEWHNSLLGHEEMIRELLVDSPLAHGTSMLRRSALESVGGWAER